MHKFKSILVVLFDCEIEVKVTVRHQSDAATLLSQVKDWKKHGQEVWFEEEASQEEQRVGITKKTTHVDFGRVLTYTIFHMDTVGLVKPGGLVTLDGEQH